LFPIIRNFPPLRLASRRSHYNRNSVCLPSSGSPSLSAHPDLLAGYPLQDRGNLIALSLAISVIPMSNIRDELRSGARRGGSTLFMTPNRPDRPFSAFETTKWLRKRAFGASTSTSAPPPVEERSTSPPKIGVWCLWGRTVLYACILHAQRLLWRMVIAAPPIRIVGNTLRVRPRVVVNIGAGFRSGGRLGGLAGFEWAMMATYEVSGCFSWSCMV